jgi:hypothetical protein
MKLQHQLLFLELSNDVSLLLASTAAVLNGTAVSLQTCVREVPGSYLCRNNGHPWSFVFFLSASREMFAFLTIQQ